MSSGKCWSFSLSLNVLTGAKGIGAPPTGCNSSVVQHDGCRWLGAKLAASHQKSLCWYHCAYLLTHTSQVSCFHKLRNLSITNKPAQVAVVDLRDKVCLIVVTRYLSLVTTVSAWWVLRWCHVGYQDICSHHQIMPTMVIQCIPGLDNDTHTQRHARLSKSFLS